MDQVPNFFQCDELITIFEEMYDNCASRKEDMCRQVALIHLLIGYANNNTSYNKENIKINKLIMEYQPIIEKYKEKWKL